ncbi:MAG: hypothetical protein QM636_00400 [Rhizobium sp.]
MSYEEPEKIALHLSSDEATVLFELLARWINDTEHPAPDGACFEDASECAVLRGVLSDLERQMAAPFRGDYRQILESARRRVTERWGSTGLRE